MNVHDRFTRFKSAHRQMASVARIGQPHSTTSNGHGAHKGLQGTWHLPDSLPATRHWRDRFRAWWHRLERQWEPVRVNKQIDSVTMPKWIAIGIFGAVLTFGVQSWWRESDRREAMIRLETEVRMSREFSAEKDRQVREQAELNELRIDNITGELKTIKGMLSAQQSNAIEQIKRGSN